MRRAAGLAVCLFALAGCDSSDLWARWQAERGLWKAERLVERMRIQPRLTADHEMAHAQEVFRRIERQFPASRWTRPEVLARRIARDVAEQSGRASIAVARLDESRGWPDSAVAGYERVMRDYAAVPSVKLEAAIGRATTLQRAEDPRAADAWRDVADGFPVIDDERRDVVAPVLQAPFRAAELYRASGHDSTALAVLRAAESRWSAALVSLRYATAGPELWTHLSRARSEQRDPARLDGALDAMRRALPGPNSGARKPSILMSLGEVALEGGQSDTALVYARWAQSLRGRVGADALLLEARIWETEGRPDSAADAYGRLTDAYPNALEAGSIARFRRGLVFEQLDRWEQARSEYRALAAFNPSYEGTMQSYERIVAHHMGRGEAELAEMEGRHGLDALDRLVATYQDPEVVWAARTARARLLVALGRNMNAFEALSQLWDAYAGTPRGTAAAMEAARLAETRLNDPARARRLYEEVATRGTPPEQRQEARTALARLGEGG